MRDCDRRVARRMPHELGEALVVIAQGEHGTVATRLRRGAYHLLEPYRVQHPRRYGTLTGRIRDAEDRPRRPAPVRTEPDL
jgi:hypothetical protein